MDRFIHHQKPENCIQNCEAQCCYEAEIFCANESQLNAVLEHNPKAIVRSNPGGGSWVMVEGLCGCNSSGICLLHENNDLYPDGCRRFELAGEECLHIRRSEHYPIDLMQTPLAGNIILLTDIEG